MRLAKAIGGALLIGAVFLVLLALLVSALLGVLVFLGWFVQFDWAPAAVLGLLILAVATFALVQVGKRVYRYGFTETVRKILEH